MFCEVVSFIVLTLVPLNFQDFLNVLLPQQMVPHIPGLAAFAPHAGMYEVVHSTVVRLNVGRALGVSNSF